MLDNLFAKGKPLYKKDEEEYIELKKEYLSKEEKDLAWSVGAGFDLSILEKKVHNEIKNAFLTNTPLLLSDWHPNCYHILKIAYDILGDDCFTSEEIEEYLRSHNKRFSKIRIFHNKLFYKCGYYEINQMIPIKLFSKKEFLQINKKYESFLRNQNDRLLYEDLHVMYFDLTYYDSKFDLFYFPMRAIIMVKEIIERFQIPLMTVLTLGSWKGGEYLGDDSEFFNALMSLPTPLRFEFFITNQRFLDHSPNFSWCAQISNFNMGNAMIYRIRS